MDVGGIFGKMEGNADKFGMLIGFLGPSAAVSGGDFIGDLMGNFNALTRTPHIPNFGALFSNLMGGGTEESKYFLRGVQGWIIGYIMKEIGLHPTLTRLGNFAEKAGMACAEGTLAYTLMEYSGKYQT